MTDPTTPPPGRSTIELKDRHGLKGNLVKLKPNPEQPARDELGDRSSSSLSLIIIGFHTDYASEHRALSVDSKGKVLFCSIVFKLRSTTLRPADG